MNLSIDWLLDQNLRPMINDYGSKGIELASILPLREAVVEIIELFLKTPYESVDAVRLDLNIVRSRSYAGMSIDPK